MPRLAVIGGSGFSSLPGLVPLETIPIQSPYGLPSGPAIRGRLGDRELLFLARHGGDQMIPPHDVNYRANIDGLRQCGAEWVVGLGAVGGIGQPYGPGVLAVPDQLIDYTYGRAHTFFTAGTGGKEVNHIEFTEPYCEQLRQALLHSGAAAGLSPMDGGTYGATQGPRLETAAEVRRLERDGCDLVGMTGMPEAALAREAGLCYACLAFVVNWAAGKGSGTSLLSEMHCNLDLCIQGVVSVLETLVRTHGD